VKCRREVLSGPVLSPYVLNSAKTKAVAGTNILPKIHSSPAVRCQFRCQLSQYTSQHIVSQLGSVLIFCAEQMCVSVESNTWPCMARSCPNHVHGDPVS
jgi:hypothetical protein